MIISLLQASLAFASAAAGGAVAAYLGASHRQLCALISFAAGALLATTFFHILPEALHTLPLWGVTLALGAGYGVFHLISRHVFHICPACAASHVEEHTGPNFKSIEMLLAVVLVIHSLLDGAAISLDAHNASGTGSVFFTIAIHKFPEGLALAALLLKAGYTRPKAMFLTLAFESSTLIGWLAATLLTPHLQAIGGLEGVLAVIGGGFIYLALHATLNEMERHSPRFIFLFFLCGFILLGLVR
jgi:zinc and cadmium transporter